MFGCGAAGGGARAVAGAGAAAAAAATGRAVCGATGLRADDGVTFGGGDATCDGTVAAAAARTPPADASDGRTNALTTDLAVEPHNKSLRIMRHPTCDGVVLYFTRT